MTGYVLTFLPLFIAGMMIIIMNAAMHGISKGDVLSRLDKILEFAEIERFLDQPLKHY